MRASGSGKQRSQRREQQSGKEMLPAEARVVSGAMDRYGVWFGGRADGLADDLDAGGEGKRAMLSRTGSAAEEMAAPPPRPRRREKEQLRRARLQEFLCGHNACRRPKGRC